MNNWEMEQAFIQMIEMFPGLVSAQRAYYEELIKAGFKEDEVIYLVGELLANIMGLGK